MAPLTLTAEDCAYITSMSMYLNKDYLQTWSETFNSQFDSLNSKFMELKTTLEALTANHAIDDHLRPRWRDECIGAFSTDDSSGQANQRVSRARGRIRAYSETIQAAQEGALEATKKGKYPNAAEYLVIGQKATAGLGGLVRALNSHIDVFKASCDANVARESQESKIEDETSTQAAGEVINEEASEDDGFSFTVVLTRYEAERETNRRWSWVV